MGGWTIGHSFCHAVTARILAFQVTAVAMVLLFASKTFNDLISSHQVWLWCLFCKKFSRKPADRLAGVVDGETFGRSTQSLVGESEECIISIMRGLGGNVNRLLPEIGFHVDDRKVKGGQRARTVVGPRPGEGDARLWWPLN